MAESFEMVRLRWVICDLNSACLRRKRQASEGGGAVPAIVKDKAEVVGEQSYVQRNP
jgi:hypothetical protein